ncbi:MAG: hypothetical protein FWC65_04830 [Treponema sp.]|nr:hypothetical protein [Treponema sp.]
MFHVVKSISIPNISHNMMHGGRMSFPVDPAFLVYSNFEHVYGTAAPQGTQGVAISQLKLLDVLIGQLSRLRREPPPPVLTSPDGATDATTDAATAAAQVDAIIEAYRSELAQGLTAAVADSAAMPYIPAPRVEAGAVFSVVA